MDKITRRQFVKSAAITGTTLSLMMEKTMGVSFNTGSDDLTLVAAGDAMVTRSLEPFFQSGSNNYKTMLDLLRDADIAMANLEACLTERGHPVEKLATLRGNLSIAGELKSIGIEVLTVANNHIMDFGYEGLFDTLKALDDNEIKHVGAGRDLEEAMAPVVFERKGVRVGFLGFSSCLPLGAEAGESRPGVAPIRVSTAYEIDPTVLQEQPGTLPLVRTTVRQADIEAMRKSISRAKAGVDFLVVTIHWGVAYQDNLADYQQPVAHAMIDSGADLIIGHHPHVPHAIEIYKNKHIFYSLGNLFLLYERVKKLARYLQNIGTDPARVNTNETFIVRASIKKKSEPATIRIIPIVIDERGFPYLADEQASSRIIERVRKLSESLATIDMQGNLGIVKS